MATTIGKARRKHPDDAADTAAGKGLELEVKTAEGSRRLVIEATEELVLKCGKSSVTLTKEGKIVVKGVRVVSRASHRNSIKGAQIDLN